MLLLYSMPQSLSHLIVHAVFSTKDRRPFLHSEEIRIETYAYMAGILMNLQCHPIKIGGVDDHIYILSSSSKNIAFADLIGRVKGSSSCFRRMLSLGIMPATRPPLQDDSLRDVFPGLKPWAVLFSPFGRRRNVQTPASLEGQTTI